MKSEITYQDSHRVFKYNKETGDLTVSVFDELGEILESIEINNDEDDNLSKGPVDELGINLN